MDCTHGARFAFAAAPLTCALRHENLGMACTVRKARQMAPFIQTLALILDVAFTLLLVHVIMSWLINFQVLNLGQPLVAQIWQGLNRLFEPVFRPVRNILPNTHPLDLAPLVVFILIIALRDYFLPSLY